MQVNLSK